jgi:Tfp pilus assembly protein PilF
MSILDRIQILIQFTKEEPENPFNWYALALEYCNTKPTETVMIFDQLLAEKPDYLPTYYTSAVFFAELGELEKAKSIFEKGIQLAQKTNQTKALGELKNKYQNFLFEHDMD